MIPATIKLVLLLVGVPRIRGDDPRRVVRVRGSLLCSPHTRG